MQNYKNFPRLISIPVELNQLWLCWGQGRQRSSGLFARHFFRDKIQPHWARTLGEFLCNPVMVQSLENISQKGLSFAFKLVKPRTSKQNSDFHAEYIVHVLHVPYTLGPIMVGRVCHVVWVTITNWFILCVHPHVYFNRNVHACLW